MSHKNIIQPTRQSDEAVEKICANFLDNHFWSKKDPGSRRCHDKESQLRGIDLVFRGIPVDEKVKNKNSFGTYTSAPSVEILTTDNQFHRYDCRGWFVKPESETRLYAFINIMGYSTQAGITELDVFLFRKSDLEDRIGPEVLKTLYDRARNLKHNGTRNFRGKITEEVNLGTESLWLSYSYKLKEKPVNLVTPMQFLKTLPVWLEYRVTPETVSLVGKNHTKEN